MPRVLRLALLLLLTACARQEARTASEQPSADPVDERQPRVPEIAERQDDDPTVSTEPEGGVRRVSDPGAPPASAEAICATWQDCGPFYDDPNSGFECQQERCTCDPTGEWATVCGSIAGIWIASECYCVVGGSEQEPDDEPEAPEDAEEDVACWWAWRWTYCDADRWVDRSYVEEVCDAYGCWNETVEDGYWIDGKCYGRWIKRCTDGNEYWY